ncbi:hypothetical protein D3C75_1334320 [compost metagenome]
MRLPAISAITVSWLLVLLFGPRLIDPSGLPVLQDAVHIANVPFSGEHSPFHRLAYPARAVVFDGILDLLGNY